MKKKLLSILCTMLIAGLFYADIAAAQDDPEVRLIRDLNTYDNLTSIDQISDHPLTNIPVQFTAVLASYPKSSGLASFNENDGTIGRIHVFIADTNAVTLGRDGMYIQVVQPFGNPEFDQLEDLTRGDVITVIARLTFFGEVAQLNIDEIISLDGNVFNEGGGFEEYAPLTEPMEVSPSEFHTDIGGGQIQLDLDGYQKFNGMYIKISNATTSNTTFGDRPNIRTNSGGSFVYNRDISLRYRNDRPNYRTGYNFRRPTVDGDFEPPFDGSQINISGFLVIDDFNVDSHFPAGEGAFFISPMEDGVLWLNDVRFENGDDIGGGEIFEWPVDFEVLSQPARIVEATLSPDPADGLITTSDVITVTATAVGPDDDPGITVDQVELFWFGTDIDTTSVVMSNIGGDDYQADLPTFSNFTSVSVFMEVTDSEGNTTRFPAGSNISFFVADDEINSIELIQKTGDELDGPSPLADQGVLPMDITATVVSGGSDGIVAIHDAAGAWSGVFLELNQNTQDLLRGDVITITEAEVREASVASNDNTYTYLTNLTFDVTGSGTLLSTVVPELTTDQILAFGAPGEAFEGVLVKVVNAEIINILSFGEFEIASVPAGGGEVPTEGIIINDDTRAGVVGETGFPDDVNIHAKVGSTLDEFYGFGTFTFGAAKFIPRDINDLVGVNFTIPRPEFNLLTPEDEAFVAVTGDIGVTWQALDPADYDGDAVTYEWVLYTPDSTEVIAVTSDNEGSDPMVTLPFDVVDGLLESNGLSVGETIDLLWNVRVSDGTDTLAVASGFDFDTDEFETLFFGITLERNEATSIDDGEGLSGVPRTFELKQNYPNPFNPSTVIRYAVPEASNVRIDVYNVLGQRVSTLVNREHQAGNFDVTFDASNLSSGMYFYRLESVNAVLTQKMMLIK